MSHRFRRFLCLLPLLTLCPIAAAQETVESYLREYPNQEQVKMMNTWLEKNEKGSFKFTGLVDPSDTTVVTPQATVDYGYNWFSISDGPAILTTPTYDKFLSVSVFDMKHNVPAVITNPAKPILLKRPGQAVPEGEQERRVIKGGSFLCADNYCHRFRPSALMGQTLDTATCHMGFRCVVDR